MRLRNVLLASLAHLSVLAQNTTSPWPWQTFKSLPGLEPPVLSINKTGETSPGMIFFPQSGSGAHNYSLNIFREDGELVWVSGYGDYAAFRRTTLFGEPVLAYFKGISFAEPWGFGYGIIYILNQQYENIYNVTLWNETYPLQSIYPLYDPTLWKPFSWVDMHENLITPEGTMFIGAMNVTPWDLSSVGGPKDGWIVDSIAMEVNVTNSEILWEWSHLDHVDEVSLESAVPTYPLGDLGRNSSYPWGPFHINSIERFEDGSLLISSRHYCSIYKVKRNGTVEWTLNGYSGGDFTLANNLSFCYQHDARIHPSRTPNTTTISLFNNDNSAVVSHVNQSTGIFLSVDERTMTATLLQELVDPDDTIYSVSQGNMEVLPSGNSVLGYGSVPTLKEFDKDGNVVLSVSWGEALAVQSYRDYKAEWVGKPSAKPDVFACRAHNGTEVYMSWNGATEHKTWTVFGGAVNGSLSEVVSVEKTGFETKASVEKMLMFVKVEASGEAIDTGVSNVVSVSGMC
ncbi:Arylsulfotran-2 multi-domain protein [Pyrenophora tritici-repentis]|uniref:Arylsulfotran-2 multi-domain protein n=1 Tax=Pyrenophora tritici-repentis TaxID=45151 RepID=A0A2W1DYA7_9PLEO|nr:Arylsulfotran-2 multi-domain protein [Pyrenophora tritici-repentis]KAF7453358.1 Arylsulfotran-2 multi-domain protein [Pyrenophora tritici-repentis]KAF7576422.1 Arylsulfotran-2 multi-domain protein [Pyrenophora tritici-repentis]KAG9387112.1 Arylsulfotran-2 multi-domain protein [Pyrenophora tritici-repentis]KAI0572605.1 Arylsulfotran-2 multi-domain protein [Pyrenophora tritici-repentis]